MGEVVETNKIENEKLNPELIDTCLKVLQQLNQDTDQIFDIPEGKRLELIKIGRASCRER